MAKTVLIIDDNKFGRDIVKMTLEGAGFTVLAAGEGNEGLEMLQKNQVDLVLLDLILPGLDGFGVLGLIKSDPKTQDIPVFVLTGRDSQDEYDEAIRLGAKECFIKYRMPHVELVKVVKQFLK
ncbi:MAG: response regulator [Candidatus Omnitrophica bacterium]|jgi:CheY-like chemotaxis protein|nr:response regulator [Candidatus Omnitrophota bacterium]MDD5078994.1 response regulator [Candidatus Omnitrophota bacterium]